jgi:hypothetical protein
MSWSNQLSSGIEKVGRTENYLFGYAGRLGFLAPTYDWIAGLDADKIHPQNFWRYRDTLDLPDGENAGNALIADRDGNIWLIALDGFANPIKREFDAIGSGSDYALGAMLHGADAATAVECATKMDAHTGGSVHNWTFTSPVHCPNER